MGAVSYSIHAVRRSRALEAAAIVLTLLALAAVVWWGRHQVRDQLRRQLMGRDALILQALAAREAVAADPDGQGDPTDFTHQYAVLLGMADLTNIIAARLFDASGAFVAGVPTEVKEASLGEATLETLRRDGLITRFRPGAPRQELFLALPDLEHPEADVLPWLEVYVPLPGHGTGPFGGVAQFVLEGATLEREFARLDHRLNRQSLLVFGCGALVIVLGLARAFHQLARANALLAARTTDLERANQALADAARTTAVGAVTAHLIHSLKNPVAGLQSFVVARQDAAAAGENEEWREALAATRRMQSLIHQVVEVLQDQQAGPGYSLGLAEVAEAVTAQLQPLARRREVSLEAAVRGEGTIDNHVTGLLRLVLVNLIQNALEATPPGGRVTLHLAGGPGRIVAEVRDTGPGVPEAVRARLFEPVRSAKEGGSGIGLAISGQLARHLGAELTLASSSASGTVFRVVLPSSRA